MKPPVSQFKKFDVRELLREGVEPFPEIRRRVDFVSRNKGGRGAVREVIDAILRARKLI